MKRPQFTVASLLLGTAFVAVALGGMMFNIGRIYRPFFVRDIVAYTLMLSPFWLPFVFIGYMLGRRTITIWTLVAFVGAEVAAGFAVWLGRSLQS